MPPPDQRSRILRRLYMLYSDVTWSIPSDFLSRDHFRRVVLNLDYTSSPGYPYMRSYPTNRDMLKPDEDGNPDPIREELLWQMVQTRLQEGDMDPIRLFIKPEPHKLKKLEGHRYRLISSVSVVDQVVHAMLFGVLNDKMSDNWPYIPNKSGWSPHYGGYRNIPLTGWMATDKSGWDWSAQPWTFEMVFTLRKMLCQNLEEHPLWEKLAARAYQQLYTDPVFINTYGHLLQQKKPGVQKSGCFNTLADNCIQQVIIHYRVCDDLGLAPGQMMCMGDDVYQQTPPDKDRYLEKLGEYCRLKEAAEVPEFAGYRFGHRRIEPLYKGKHAFVLLHLNEQLAQDTLDSYSLMYHESRDRDFVRALIRIMGYETRPLEWADEIFHGH
ncbi:hypothetical protein 2 [Hubei sobemo-like virus 25]|uniref:hypothetical protein 2 n=1 Tax=Hubei sobemo-like virus 25 TaxID=1923211 RepID=UPI00090C64AA|nr:hypothetical protein 2 [Hubei sobemo-like virus 25]APG75796.1 hypothetical protein 2 [Hubei sobemo-like virus 25]